MDLQATIRSLSTKPWVIPTSVGLASGLVGGAAGYLIAKKRFADQPENEDFEFNHNEIAYLDTDPVSLDDIREAKRLEVMKEHPASANDEGEDEDQPTFRIEKTAYDEIVLNPRRDPSEIVGGIPQVELKSEEDEDGDEVVSIWEGVDSDVPGWDWENEQKHRLGTEPYILHKTEFLEQETDYDQQTLTYYAGDDKLTDERDVPLYNVSEVVGSCLQWGHGSGDPNVVYIRNDKLHAEYEVVKHDGRFEVEVLGLDEQTEYEEAELKHSAHRIYKFPKE